MGRKPVVVDADKIRKSPPEASFTTKSGMQLNFGAWDARKAAKKKACLTSEAEPPDDPSRQFIGQFIGFFRRLFRRWSLVVPSNETPPTLKK